MKPSEKGWLKEYLNIRRNRLLELTYDEFRKTSHPEQALYKIIQPTGLMYGQAVGRLNIPGFEQWSEKERMQVLLAECLISSSLLFYNKPVKDKKEFDLIAEKALENIGNFYNTVFPELSTPAKTLFGKKRTPDELAEIVLEKRVSLKYSVPNNFWALFFRNSLLFLDVFIFGQWSHTNADKIVADFFKYEREEMRFSVVKVMAAAAHANKEVVPEEQKLFDYFLQITDLPSEKRREAKKIFEEGIAIEDINLPSENSWILKKFFLEIGILTLWADKKVEQEEFDFLKRFCHYFDFTDEDLENSLIAIEGFVLEYWNKLDHLSDKKDYQQVSEQFINRMARIAEKNYSRLLKEIEQNGEVSLLLRKAAANELTETEIEEVREKLIQILKAIPAFDIISLPQKFLQLPVLLKILPKSVFIEHYR